MYRPVSVFPPTLADTHLFP